MQVDNLQAYCQLHNDSASIALGELKSAALNQGNIFECLMEAAKSSSLGQMSSALYNIGGLYRRNM
jgi:methylmalonyl-CoA mutase